MKLVLRRPLPTGEIGILFLACSMLILPGLASAATVGAQVRPAAVAGSWYPEDASELDALLEGLLSRVPPLHAAPAAPVRAIISPHAGYRHSGATAAAGFRTVEGRRVQRVIVLGPSHRADFRGLSVPTVAAYQTPLGQVQVDLDAVAQLRRHAMVAEHPAAHLREHSIEMQLPFLQEVLEPGWKLLPVLVGQMNDGDYRRAASLLRPLANADTLIVVSTDFTHYGAAFDYLPFPPDSRLDGRIRDLDLGAYEQIAAISLQGFLDYRHLTGITICGHRPLAVLLAMLPETASVSLRGYAVGRSPASPSPHSVSYLSAVIREPPMVAGNSKADDSDGDWISPSGLRSLHELASRAVEQAVSPSPANGRALQSLLKRLPEELSQPFGVFVTLWKNGELRACRGHVRNGQPLYSLAIRDGMNAALYDFRSPPLRVQELAQLDIEISILGALQPINSLQEWAIGQQGLYLNGNDRHALYLPQVPSLAGWDAKQTLSHLCQKAGLKKADCRSRGATLDVFSTQTYSAPFMVR